MLSESSSHSTPFSHNEEGAENLNEIPEVILSDEDIDIPEQQKEFPRSSPFRITKEDLIKKQKESLQNIKKKIENYEKKIRDLRDNGDIRDDRRVQSKLDDFESKKQSFVIRSRSHQQLVQKNDLQLGNEPST